MPESDLKRPTIVSAALLAAYAAAAAWLFHEQSTSWPHEGSWALVAYVFLCPGIVFQAFNLAYLRLKGRALARRVLTRAVTIPLGLLLAGQLVGEASTRAMSGFERAYAPFVSLIGASLADPCAAAGKYFAIPAVSAYNEQAGRRPTTILKYDNKRFVVSFPGDSIDMDGSKIYFDSGAKVWSKFHNNEREKAAALGKLTEGLAECTLRAP